MRVRPHELVTGAELTKPRRKGAQGTLGRKEGAHQDGRTRGRSGTEAPAQKEGNAVGGLDEKCEVIKQRENKLIDTGKEKRTSWGGSGRFGVRGAGGALGRVCRAEPCPGQQVAGDWSLEGSWHRLGPPTLPGLAELPSLRGPLGRLSARTCLPAGRGLAAGMAREDPGGGRRGPPGRSRAGAAEAQPDVRSGLGACGGSVRGRGWVQGLGLEVAQWRRGKPR